MNRSRNTHSVSRKAEHEPAFTAGTKRAKTPDDSIVVAQITYTKEDGIGTADIKRRHRATTNTTYGVSSESELVLEHNILKKHDLGSSLFQADEECTSPEYVQPGRVRYTDTDSPAESYTPKSIPRSSKRNNEPPSADNIQSSKEWHINSDSATNASKPKATPSLSKSTPSSSKSTLSSSKPAPSQSKSAYSSSKPAPSSSKSASSRSKSTPRNPESRQRSGERMKNTSFDMTNEEVKALYKEQDVKFLGEYKQWDRLISDHKLQAAKSQKLLKDIRNGDDPRRVLHGPRRSRYKPPPKFSFSCQDIIEEMQSLATRGEIAEKIIRQQENSRDALTYPADTDSDQSQIHLNRVSDHGASSIFEKSTRAIFTELARKGKH